MSISHLHKPVRNLDGLSLYIENDVAYIVMDRGQNRINPKFMQDFSTLLDDVEKSPDCKGLITTAVGKFFSNGLDLEMLATVEDRERNRFLSDFKDFIGRILFFPLPTLAAINGHSFAGGAILALAHDLRVMRSDRGWFCLNEVWLGYPFPGFLLTIVREKLGSRNMSNFVVLGKKITAEEAHKAGVVSTVTSENLMLRHSERLLRSYFGTDGYPKDSLAGMKKSVYNESYQVFKAEWPEDAKLLSHL